jgi:hypothetical protein
MPSRVKVSKRNLILPQPDTDALVDTLPDLPLQQDDDVKDVGAREQLTRIDDTSKAPPSSISTNYISTLSQVISFLDFPFTLNGQLGDPDYDSSSWLFNPALFSFVRDLTRKRTGFDVNADLHEIKHVKQDFSRAPDDTKIEDTILFVNSNWDFYGEIIPKLVSLGSLRSVIVAPVKDTAWSATLERLSIIIGELPRSPQVFLPKSTDFSAPIDAYDGCARVYWLHFEAGTGARGLIQHYFDFPSVQVCSDLVFLPPPKPRPPLPVVDFHLLASKPKQPYSLVEWTALAHHISDTVLRSKILHSLRGEGQWRTGTMGPRNVHFDTTVPHTDEETKILTAKIQPSIAAGFFLGPYRRPPFPAPWCKNSQPTVSQTFTRRKHKHDPESKSLRVVFNKSLPPNFSTNDRTPRQHSGRKFHAFLDFLFLLFTIGSGALFCGFDGRNAYKNNSLSPFDWHRQCFKIGNSYYVDTTGTFGDVSAGDNWDLLCAGWLDILRGVTGYSDWHAYVDNVHSILPPDFANPRSWFKKALIVSRRLGIPIHQIFYPCTRLRDYLGWDVDSVPLTASIPTARMSLIQGLFVLWLSLAVCSLSQLDSMVGIFGYISTVVSIIRPARGYVIQLQTRCRAAVKSGKWPGPFKVTTRAKHGIRLMQEAIELCNGTWKLERLFSTEFNLTIYGDAGLTFSGGAVWGQGAYTVETRQFYAEPWSQDVIKRSHRLLALSSTYVEVLNLVIAVMTFSKKSDRVRVYTDSMDAMFILQKHYSASEPLLAVLHTFDVWCVRNDVCVTVVEWIAREYNVLADLLSHGKCTLFQDQVSVKYSRVTPSVPDLPPL